MKIGSGIHIIVRYYLKNLEACNVAITDMKNVFKYSVEIASGGIKYLRSFMTIGLGIQGILRIIHQQYKKL
jgi:hypothetical protein